MLQFPAVVEIQVRILRQLANGFKNGVASLPFVDVAARREPIEDVLAPAQPREFRIAPAV